MDRPTINPKKNIYRDSDRYLIAELPGMAVLLSGLILAFFIGYTTKSVFSTQRVTAKIQKAASHIHKDVRAQFSSAALVLSEGILPRFSVVISDVKLETDQVCWLAPKMEIDRLRLPLSVWAVLTGKSPVQKVVADNVQLTLRADGSACPGQKNPVTIENELAAPTTKIPPAQVTLSPLEQSEKYGNAVRAISIKKLNIVHTNYPQYATDLLDFDVRVRSFEPKVVEVRAKTHLLKDEQVGDYLSHANIYLEYRESPEATLQTHFFGNWREGHYSMIANYAIYDRMLTMEGDLRHIPLSQVLKLLKKYQLVSHDLTSKQAWVSTKARLVADIDRLKDSPFEVTGFQIEGDVGELDIDRIAFSSIEPLRYAPIKVDIKDLNVEKLLEFFNRPGKSRMLGDLGRFTGRAEIVSEKNISLSGEHAGLEFIFSNRGRQELQTLTSLQGEANFRNDQWNFDISRLQPENGNAIGGVKMKADRDFKNVNIHAQIEDLFFAPTVQKLMTNNGNVGGMGVNVNLQLNSGEIADLKGQFMLDELKTEGMEFKKIKAQMSGAKKEFNIQIQSDGVNFTSESAGGVLLSPLQVSSGPIDISKISGTLKSHEFKDLEWKNFQGQVVGDGRISTDGSWSPLGNLRGKVQIKEGKTLRHFDVTGTRDNPQISASKEGSARR